MKRIILLILLSYIYIGTADAQFAKLSPQKQGWDEDYPLYGKIQTLTMLKYNVSDKFGELVKNLIVKQLSFSKSKREYLFLIMAKVKSIGKPLKNLIQIGGLSK